MKKYPAYIRIGGPILGLIIVFFVVNSFVGRIQNDQAQLREEARISQLTESEAPAETDAPAETPAETPAEAPAEAPASDPATSDAPAQMVAMTAPANVAAAFNKGGCAGCHVIPGVPGANGQVGPDLSTIGVDGASRVDGVAADAYIRESIMDPNAVIAPACPLGDCPPNVMLQSFAQTLTSADLDTIVGYLASLGTDASMLMAAAPAEAVALDLTLPAESVLDPFTALPKDPAKESQIALGKYLFFDSRLSNNNSLSCASCHMGDATWTDGQALSQGYPSTAYFRNTPTVLNTVFSGRLYWDGRMDGSDMPTLVRDHLTEAHFMSIDGRLMAERVIQIPAYADAFQEAFGGEPSFGRILNAITAYVQSLNSPAIAYDAFKAGDSAALSADAAAGLALFEGKAQCSTCHSGALLSDDAFYNLGVETDAAMLEDFDRVVTFRRFFRTLGVPNYRALTEDVGLYALTQDEADWGKFNTPSLREVAATAPYMHNGSLATLTDVVNFYNGGGGESQTVGLAPLGLSDAEVAQLVAFLETLKSDLAPVEAPALPDYGVLPLGVTPEPAAEAAPAEAPAAAAPAAEAPAQTVALSGEELKAAASAAITKGTCNACHVITEIPGAVGVIGPNLDEIGAVAAERVAGLSAQDYLYQSILEPNAYIVPDCPLGPCVANVMLPNLADILTAEEIDTIVAYLATLGGN